ncbi:ABC transporter [Clostridia bacterium]|nr:ABC transporter [Clostridia bacterium]
METVTEAAGQEIAAVNKIPDYELLFREPEAARARKKPPKKSPLLRKLIKANFWSVFFSQILYLIKASPLWVMPLIVADVIDAAQAGSDGFSVRLLIDGAILAVMLAQNIPMHMWYANISDRMTRKVNAGLKSTLIRKLQRLSITYHKEMESGRIQSKFLRDLDAADALFGNIVRILIPNILMTLIFTAIAFLKCGPVAVFFLLAVPLNLLLIKLFSRRIRRNARVFRNANESLSADVATMLEMYAVTKAHGLEHEQFRNLQREITNVMNKGRAADKSIALFGSAIWVLSNLLSSACVFLAAWFAVQGRISIGDIVLYQAMFLNISGFVQGIIGVFPQFTTGFEAMSSISEVMSSEDIERQGERRLTPVRGDIQFKNVTFRYHDGEAPVIKNLDLHISPGECVALVGASGSGKSTICNMIIGFLDVKEGELLIDDIPIPRLNLTEYRRHIAVVPQNALLFRGTIAENITYGLPEYPRERLNDVLKMANIDEFLPSLPKGADTNVGEHGGLLSGGQRQRVTIARALIRDPKILILDEATSALDNLSEAQVQKAVAESVKDRTTIVVAHRLSTIRNADRIVVMDAGECVETGSYEELLEKRGLFYRMDASARNRAEADA